MKIVNIKLTQEQVNLIYSVLLDKQANMVNNFGYLKDKDKSRTELHDIKILTTMLSNKISR